MEDTLRDKEIEVEKLSSSKQQEGGSLRTTLQAKEVELTRTMDKLLQVSCIIMIIYSLWYCTIKSVFGRVCTMSLCNCMGKHCEMVMPT